MMDDEVWCPWPPRGWYCTRPVGHPGPCAARPRWWMRAWLWINRA